MPELAAWGGGCHWEVTRTRGLGLYEWDKSIYQIGIEQLIASI